MMKLPNQRKAGTVGFMVWMDKAVRAKWVNLAAQRATRDAAARGDDRSEISAQSILRHYINGEIAAEEAEYGPLPTEEPAAKPKRPKKGGRKRKGEVTNKN